MAALHEVPPPEPPIDQPEPPDFSDETLKLIFESTRDRPAQQLRDIDALDTKIVQVFSAASVVIGLAGIGAGIAANPGGGATATATQPVLGLVGAVIGYLMAGALSLWNLRPQDVYPSPNARTLWDTHWDVTPRELQHALVVSIRDASIKNHQVISRKARLLAWTMGVAYLEVLCVGFSLIAGRLPA